MCSLLLSLLTTALIPNAVGNQAKSGELHSNPQHLKTIFLFDRLVGDGLRYFPLFPSTNDRIKRYLDSHRCLVADAVHYNGDTTHPAFIGNPLHVYALIKRLVLHWPDTRDILHKFLVLKRDGPICQDRDSNCLLWSREGRCVREAKLMIHKCPESCGICIFLDHIDKIKAAEEKTVLPSTMDLEAAAMAIGRLQNVYKLPITHLSSGRIYNSFSCVELNEWDWLRIAQASFKDEKYVTAWFWYNHARSNTENLEVEDYADYLIENLAKVHDENWENQKASTDYFERPLTEVPIQPPRTSSFFQLCRGESIRVLNGLKCEVSTLGAPFFFLQPIKREMVVHDPEIYIYYDVITELEMETLKLLSQDMLQVDNNYENRVSWQTFIHDNMHPILESINHRVSLLTGLLTYETPEGTGPGEPFKIREYGTGGYLDPHVDVYYKHLENASNSDVTLPRPITGDRMATVMFYLNDVEAGGRTAFYYAGVSVAPTKGSAVVWYNLKRNGKYNRLVDHAGCPVVLGRKWLAIKWILENDNFLRRQCSINPEE